MRIFVTGGSGFIGSAVVPELLGAGHEVVGLARSEASAAALAEAGAHVRRGGLADLDVLRDAAADSDGVVHLAFIHDFSNFAESSVVDAQAIATFGDALAGSDRPLVIASGLLGLPTDRVVTEADPFGDEGGPRAANARAALALAARGVRSSAVRLAPTVHGAGDHGFLARIVQVAREQGVSGYVGDGANHWPAVHQRDAATLFRLAVERAPAGSVLHGCADEGVPLREVAEVIGRHLDLPVAPVALADAEKHFGWLGRFLQMDVRASSMRTQELLDWYPEQPGLLADLEAGHYFDAPAVLTY